MFSSYIYLQALASEGVAKWERALKVLLVKSGVQIPDKLTNTLQFPQEKITDICIAPALVSGSYQISEGRDKKNIQALMSHTYFKRVLPQLERLY